MIHSRQYTQYLQSASWQDRRLAKLESSKFKCDNCGEGDSLQVHHLTYDRLGNEESTDLIVLCQSCHWVADEIRSGNAALSYNALLAHDKSSQQFNTEKNTRELKQKSKPKRRLSENMTAKKRTTFSGNEWRRSIGKVGK